MRTYHPGGPIICGLTNGGVTWLRYVGYLPLYHQAPTLVRRGIELERATLAFWVGYAAAEIPGGGTSAEGDRERLPECGRISFAALTSSRKIRSHGMPPRKPP